MTPSANLVNLYYSTKPSMNYTFRDGTVAHFVNGTFFTALPKQIEELNDLVASGNPFIYIKEGKEQIDRKLLDPTEALKARIREELIAEMKAGPVEKDLGNVAPPDIMSAVTTTADVAGATSTSGKKVVPSVTVK